MKLYLAVTADRFELPIYIEDSPGALAEKLGLTRNSVVSRINKHCDGSRCGYRVIRVVIDNLMDT